MSFVVLLIIMLLCAFRRVGLLESLTFHNPIGLHGLLRDSFTFYFWSVCKADITAIYEPIA
jgi:hypothetical protein